MDAHTTWRKVLLFKPGTGGILLGSISCRAVPHVPTHIFCAVGFGTGLLVFENAIKGKTYNIKLNTPTTSVLK